MHNQRATVEVWADTGWMERRSGRRNIFALRDFRVKSETVKFHAEIAKEDGLIGIVYPKFVRIRIGLTIMNSYCKLPKSGLNLAL
jgi:hypothetical protein